MRCHPLINNILIPPPHRSWYLPAQALALVVLLLTAPATCSSSLSPSPSPSCKPARPAAAQRTFASPAVEATIAKMSSVLKDPELACLFANTFPNCVDTTVARFLPDAPPFPEDAETAMALGAWCPCMSTQGGDAKGAAAPARPQSFVITGDIPAMWARDAMGQTMPYMGIAKGDAQLQGLLHGLVNRLTDQVLLDPYANAFSYSRAESLADHMDDQTSRPSFLGTTVSAMAPPVFERKYELDTLMSFFKVSFHYFRATGDATPLNNTRWLDAVDMIVNDVLPSQQTATADDPGIYRFQRCSSCEPTDTLSHGIGNPARATGMVRTAFRNSDDACVFPFNIPANAMAVVELRHAAALLQDAVFAGNTRAAALATQCLKLATQVDQGIQQHGVVPGPDGGAIFAYEVDGYGNSLFMDDAGVPSLLALPYLGYVPANDSTYLRTRKAILSSSSNPWFFSGSAGNGTGGPHVGIGHVWPMGIIARAITSTDPAEVSMCLAMLKASSAGTGFMHESFDANNVNSYTRPWFAWVNSFFAELILHVADTMPHLVLRAGRTSLDED